MEEVERRYQCVMIGAVQNVKTAADGLQVLNIFKPLAPRKSLFAVFFVMIDNVSFSCLCNKLNFKSFKYVVFLKKYF